ncbi:ATP-binding protein [Apibacter muscae]|uniref:ATP-dependent nuclease n=1 Tax=Apibacter muscae TaxID=2509004 RepID=UPI0011ABB812|nr:AAA family ATPase [Apibacter muscae]TWP29599.1 ATP-binding protein [Apibacter muscae]
MDSFTPYFFIDNIQFNDSTNIDLNYNDIIVFVGANNSGKSASLKEMYSKLENIKNPTKIIKEVRVKKNRPDDEIKKYITENSIIEKSSFNNYKGYGYSFNEHSLDFALRSSDELNFLRSVFANFIGTEDRLVASNPPDNIDFIKNPYTHPIHFLYRDDTIEAEFSDYFKSAFNKELIVHRVAGNIIPLYIGEKPILNQGEDRVSTSYIEKLEKLDLLHEQGDGMRSFVGVLLHSFIATQNILFIDEPEAFLHPPQAKLLGKMLSNNLPSHKQLFLSTHSEDFLQGLLDSGHERLKIIRINRVQNINYINHLENSNIKEIWSDSILRHSNILSGLFHKKVVICESDSDCRFYSAILSSITDNESIPSPDLLFIHCGGKHRIPVVVKSLQQLNVPTVVISDFDVLNNETPLKDIFLSLGGNWEAIKNDWKIVKDKIDEKRPELLTEDVKKEIISQLDLATDRIFPKEISNNIQSILKKASPWSEAKNNGISYIPNGDPTTFYNKIKEKFEEKGLFIVEVGELENFDKSIGNHGPKWVNEVLKKDLYNDSNLQKARDFVKKII